jgi:hypothetical protein
MPDSNVGSFIDDLSNGDKAFLGGSLILFIAMFLPWYGADVSTPGYSVSDSVNGFHSWGWLTFLILLAAVAFWTIRRFFTKEVPLPDLPVTDAVALMIGGGLEVLGVILFWIAGHSDVGSFSFPGISVGVRWGLFVALIGGIVVVVAGYIKQSEPAAVAPATPHTPPPSYGAPTSYGAPAPDAPGTPPPPVVPPSTPPPTTPPTSSGPPPAAPPV